MRLGVSTFSPTSRNNARIDWLALLVGHLLAMRTPKASRGRLIRIIDASSVPKAGRAAKRENGVWRIHSAFDLPSERFGQFVLTDEHGGEQLDRIAVVRGEIRLADRVHLQPDRIANVLADGGDVVVRAAWKNARWQQRNGEPLDLLGMLGKCKTDRIDEPVWIGRRNGPTLALRLIAARKSEANAAESRRRARRQAQKDGYQLSQNTLAAADWFILVTSLKAAEFSAEDVLALYRLRWRVELGFKRLKSLIGLHGPPGTNARSARPYILAHLVMLLLLEPLVDALEDFPPRGLRRLTRPGVWRLLHQLVKTLRQAIMPQPCLADLHASKPSLKRHLHEPPRNKREYQRMPRKF